MFAKELERRQKMAKASAAEDSPSTSTEKTAAQPAAAASEPPRQAYKDAPSSTPQLDKGRALSSEGLEGLIPRARILLQLGVTFFLGFLPFIAVVGGLFGALYFVRILLYSSLFLSCESLFMWNQGNLDRCLDCYDNEYPPCDIRTRNQLDNSQCHSMLCSSVSSEGPVS